MLSSLDSLLADLERCRQRQQKALRRSREARSQIDRIKVFLVNNPGSVRPLQPQIESALGQLRDARLSWLAAIMTEDRLRQLLRMPPQEPRNYVLERERVHAASAAL